MPSEKSPLKGGAKNGGSSAETLISKATAKAAGLGFSNLAREAMTSENLEQVSKVAADRVDEISKSLMNGTTPIRVMAMIGGIAVTFFAGTGILAAIFSFNLSRMVIEIYTLMFGLAMILMESQFVKVPADVMDKLYKYCLFLKFIWGRGGLYLITGSLQAAQGGIFNFVVGFYVMFVGTLYTFVGRASAKKLSELKHCIFSEEALKSKFKKFDKDNSGAISLEEFGELVSSLDLHMTKREMEGIFFHLDTNDDDKLEYDEFVQWWSNFDASASV
ncbi:hypothetical protein ACA910_002575 [Epithemia clementina (nom. ined.)]